MIRGQQRDCRQEIRGQAERGRTRSAQGVDPEGQARWAFVDESPHSVESGRVRGWRRMERQPDRRGPGHQHRDDRADATATCRGRLRSRLDAQVQSQFRPGTNFRQRRGSQADCFGLRAGPGGPRQIDPASSGGEGRRTANRLERRREHNRTTLKKTFSSPISSSNG